MALTLSWTKFLKRTKSIAPSTGILVIELFTLYETSS